jgi:hypothetical protein
LLRIRVARVRLRLLVPLDRRILFTVLLAAGLWVAGLFSLVPLLLILRRRFLLAVRFRIIQFAAALQMFLDAFECFSIVVALGRHWRLLLAFARLA